MKRIKSKLAIAVIAVAAIVLIAAVGAYAYWFVTAPLPGNSIASGKLDIIAVDQGQSTLTAINVAGICPGDVFGKRIYQVTSASGNKYTDMFFEVPTVTGEGTLKDNLMVSFAFMTGNPHAYWLNADGTTTAMAEATTEYTDAHFAEFAAPIADFSGMRWGSNTLAGFSNLAPMDARHVIVWYYLPLDCDSTCQDDSLTFDMSFELMQHH